MLMQEIQNIIKKPIEKPIDERREYSEIIVKEAARLKNLSGKLMELVQKNILMTTWYG